MPWAVDVSRRTANINHSSIDFPINFNSCCLQMFVLVRADGVAEFAVERMNKLSMLLFIKSLMPNGVEGYREAVERI